MKTITRRHIEQIINLPKVSHRTFERNFDSWAKELYDLSAKIKELKEQEAKLKEHLETYVAELKEGAYIGKKYMFSSYERKGSIDYSAIPMLKKIDLEEYRKESVTCWKLTKVS